MTRRGHVPQRQCAGCGGRFAKHSLVRFTVTRSLAMVDTGLRGEGRGAYTCPDPDCFERALRKKAFERRLKAAVDAGILRHDFEHLLITLVKNGKKANLRDSKGV